MEVEIQDIPARAAGTGAAERPAFQSRNVRGSIMTTRFPKTAWVVLLLGAALVASLAVWSAGPESKPVGDKRMNAAPEPKAAGEESAHELKRAIFAGGCFWGVEHHFREVAGVVRTTVGYTGGHATNPSYEDVCSGATGHAEALEVVYDPEKVSYEKLAKLFFEIHDPTQVNRQGPDRGEQYRSAVFYVDEEQKQIAERLIGILQEKGLKVATQVEEAGRFWRAEEYHQDYYNKKNSQPYCHVRVKRFD